MRQLQITELCRWCAVPFTRNCCSLLNADLTLQISALQLDTSFKQANKYDDYDWVELPEEVRLSGHVDFFETPMTMVFVHSLASRVSNPFPPILP